MRCALSPAPIQEAAVWLSHGEKSWTGRLDALARFLYHQEETEWPWSGARVKLAAMFGQPETA